MKCTKCGAEQEADVKFCTQCGAPMEHEDQTPENNGPEPADKEPASGAEAVKSEEPASGAEAVKAEEDVYKRQGGGSVPVYIRVCQGRGPCCGDSRLPQISHLLFR